MILEFSNQTWDFELLDSGDGFRLERWGSVILCRPDPQAIWSKSLGEDVWQNAWAIFSPSTGEEKGRWEIKQKLPAPWIILYKNTKFLLKLSPFKHTGIFAEQAAQWEWIEQKFKVKNEKCKVLNLFAYTGGATMLLAKMGCQVTHVDASKPAITWANENHALNKLPADSVRWILDDAVKFVKREIKRGARYEGVIMDPPAFGHSPSGKTWRFNDNFAELLHDSAKLLSPKAKFLLVNAYATNSSALALNNVMEDALKNRQGRIEFGELCLKQKNQRKISTGIFARWVEKN